MNGNLLAASPPHALRFVQGVLRWTVVFAGLLVAGLAYVVGLLHVVLLVMLVAGALWGIGVRVIAAFQRKLTFKHWRRPFDPTLWPARLQAVNRALFLGSDGIDADLDHPRGPD